jgi:hypothetical protein
MMAAPRVRFSTLLVLIFVCERHAVPDPWLAVMWLNTYEKP